MMITAKIIADSVYDTRITTFELEYPRFIHSELMTHRAFSRNAASSRAIPVAKMLDLIMDNPAMPVHWGKNQAGMQADIEVENPDLARSLWMRARDRAALIAREMIELGVHKQVANRLLEPFQHIKVVLTATELENFFNLRAHKDAQPEIQMLAVEMREAMKLSTPRQLNIGEWHLPYVNADMIANFGLEACKKISASCCAQVSYRLLDDSLDKALDVYQRLVEAKPIHASPFEHQATPDATAKNNFLGWRQLRQDIERGIV
jgi:thymidylate synthase ThyX